MSNRVDTLSSYPTPLGSVCHVRLVPASMSCTVCLCRRSQLVTRPGLSPVLPAPAVSAHLWCQHLPFQRQPQICELTDKVSSALCGVGRVNSHVCGGYCTCVWRAVYMCVFAYMYICVCIAIVHIPTVLIFAICYSPLWLLVKLPRVVKSHDCHMDQWSHFPPSCSLY